MLPAWKGHNWDSLDRLHQKGYISDPATKAKSVVLTEEGAKRSQDLVEAKVDGKELLFQFDTGQSKAELSAKYVRAFPQQFASLKGVKAGIGGAGGVRPLAAYPLPELVLHLGPATAIFSNVTAISQDRGVYPQDELFGNLGQGLLKQFRTYTIDFNRMQLTLGAHAQ